ncbi:uncharacterized protein BDW47DRAFT_133376 [Aspergillus candidus]|uniref:Mid2 domain-containing protein n=1 Tax=Aspergillus candidus TaxID=41067 RepID=A0A2I2F4U3_ASPCN|nr:hypothetical protein BDW47DRAFT_133376 [Aspergillus candidus]PLB35586.1 hypothetical protein BDW47DRAFT_133376 [Aspergillus candidus]
MVLSPQRSISLALALRAITGAAAIECYFLDGKSYTESRFYNATEQGEPFLCGEGPGMCCFENQTCEDGSFCRGKDGDRDRFTREMCSDKGWPPEKCSALCPHNREAGSEVSFCNAAHTMVCCGGSDLRDECCDNEDYAQIDDRGVIIAFGSNTIPPVPRATVTAIPSSVDLGPERTKLGVGLGVGLGIPLLLMCTMALLLFQRYRRLRANSSSLPEYPSTKETGIPLSAPAVSTKAPAQLDGRHVRPELATTEHLPQELQ